MATHSSTLAWKIPWTEEPGRLQSMGLLGVGHDWATSLPLFTFMHWRRKWQPTPVFLPGASQEWESLVGCRLWGRTELDMTEVMQQQQQQDYTEQDLWLCWIIHRVISSVNGCLIFLFYNFMQTTACFLIFSKINNILCVYILYTYTLIYTMSIHDPYI